MNEQLDMEVEVEAPGEDEDVVEPDEVTEDAAEDESVVPDDSEDA